MFFVVTFVWINCMWIENVYYFIFMKNKLLFFYFWFPDDTNLSLYVISFCIYKICVGLNKVWYTDYIVEREQNGKSFACGWKTLEQWLEAITIWILAVLAITHVRIQIAIKLCLHVSCMARNVFSILFQFQFHKSHFESFVMSVCV